MLQTLLPSRRRDCHSTTLPKPHYPSPRTKLASLVKGEVLSPEKIRATTGGIVTPPPFQNRTIPRLALNLPPLSKVRCCRPKKFGRLPEGLSLHHPFQNRTITLAFRTAIVCVCLYGFAFKLSHLAFRTAIVCVCLYGFAFKLSHLAFRRARVCVCLVGFASIAIVVVCGRWCVTASSAISVAASCSD